MTSNPEPSTRAEIQTGLVTIGDIAQRWLAYVMKRQGRVRVAKAFLTGALMFFLLAGATIAYVMTRYSPLYFDQNRDLLLTVVGFELLGGLLGSGLSHIAFGRSKDPNLAELSDLVGQMKKSSESERSAETALHVTEKFLQDLPRLVRKRSQDALLFGLVAFVLVSILARPPIGIVVGIAVWLYFRYETNMTYNREISRLEEQKRLFEQRKKDFIETL